MSFPRDDTASPCLALRGLTLSFGKQRVLDGLDWSLPAGRVEGYSRFRWRADRQFAWSAGPHSIQSGRRMEA